MVPGLGKLARTANPLLSFESACGQKTVMGERVRIVVLNALGGRPELRFIALLVQGIPRSCKLDSQLSYVDVPLCGLEQAAVQVGSMWRKYRICWRWKSW